MNAIEVSGLHVAYGPQEVVHGIDLHVESGEVVALLGPNGAGKTTTLMAIAGAVRCAAGEVRLDGTVARGPLCHRARQGLAFLPESRAIVRALTVAQNLRLARCDLKAALSLSPELEPLLGRRAGLLSGGEQQILSLTIALAMTPSVVCADELSLGLSPLVVDRMLDLVSSAARAGAGVLLVEQFARKALRVADRAYVISRGSVALQGRGADLLARIDEVEATFFGIESTEKPSRLSGLTTLNGSPTREQP